MSNHGRDCVGRPGEVIWSLLRFKEIPVPPSSRYASALTRMIQTPTSTSVSPSPDASPHRPWVPSAAQRARWSALARGRTLKERVAAIDSLAEEDRPVWDALHARAPLTASEGVHVLLAATRYNRAAMVQSCLAWGVDPSAAPVNGADDGVLTMMQYRHHSQVVRAYCEHGHRWATDAQHLARYRRAWQSAPASITPVTPRLPIVQRLQSVSDALIGSGSQYLDTFMERWLFARTLEEVVDSSGSAALTRRPRL